MAGVVRAGLRLSHGVKTTISPPPYVPSESIIRIGLTRTLT
jgi:hypothetical protein